MDPTCCGGICGIPPGYADMSDCSCMLLTPEPFAVFAWFGFIEKSVEDPSS